MINSLLAIIISTFFALPLLTAWMLQADFQAALNSANCGDTITLQAITYTTSADSYVLTKQCAGNPITIKGPTTLPEGRLNPAVVNLPKLVGNGKGYPVLTANAGAQGYVFTGIEITTNGTGYTPDLVSFGAYFSREQRLNTGHFVFDRVFVHVAEISGSDLFPSTVERSAGRGMALAVTDVTVKNSYVAGFAGRYPANNPNAGQNIDSYGIYSDAGPGPIRVLNSYVEAQFNNIFIGGAGMTTTNSATISNATTNSVTLTQVANLAIGDLVAMSFVSCVPSSSNPYAKPQITGRVTGIKGNTVSFTPVLAQYSCTPGVPDNGGVARWNGDHIKDVEIRGNFLNKPDAWNAFSNPKGWIEIKECVDCVADGNDMYSGVGTTIGLTVRNQNGDAPWSKIENFQFTNNRMRGYKWGLSLMLTDNEQPTVQSGNILVSNNLFDKPLIQGSAVMFVQMVGGHDVTVMHNTLVQPGSPVVSDVVTTGFVFKDNIAAHYQYGMQCTMGGLTCWPGLQMTGNVIIDTRWDKGDGPLSNRYPAGGFYPATVNDVGFAPDLSLSASSPYKGKASDGTDPGVDMVKLMAALGGAVTNPTPTPTPVATPSPTPLPSPSPTPPTTPSVCAMAANSPVVPEWGSGKLVVTFNGLTQSGTVSVSATSGQVTVSPQSKPVSGTSMIAEFLLQAKKKSSSVVVTGPCGSKTVNVVVQ